MNIDKILSKIEEVDPEVYERMDTRRHAMKEFAGMAGKVAVASLPLLFGSMFKKAYGQTTTARSAGDVLNFALTLEYLESAFYNMGASPFSAQYTTDGLTVIQTDETNHVKFLQGALTAANITPVSQSSFTYDFTAGGNFSDVATNYATFLAVAQAFEDTGVRAYKGQAGYIIGSAYLTAALNIHSVEARHASHVRELRKKAGAAIKPWVTGASTTASGIPSAAVDPTYQGEDNTKQAGVAIVGIGGNAFIDVNAASEAFDEILTTDQVVAIVKNFITSGLS